MIPRWSKIAPRLAKITSRWPKIAPEDQSSSLFCESFSLPLALAALQPLRLCRRFRRFSVPLEIQVPGGQDGSKIAPMTQLGTNLEPTWAKLEPT